MVSTTTVCLAAIAALAATSSVDAHGTLAKPGLKFTGTAYGGDFSATIPQSALKAQAGDNFQHYPDSADGSSKNAKAFDDAFKASSYKTLKDFIMKNQDMSKGRKKNPSTAECGFTDPTGGAAQTLPDVLEWYGGGMNHPGPCEVWCDNEIVTPYVGNCVGKYPSGKITYDKSKCTGKSRLTLYWLSTLLEWQVYIDCAKIGGGGTAAAGTTTRTSTTTATTPAAGGEPKAAAGGHNTAKTSAVRAAMPAAAKGPTPAIANNSPAPANRNANANKNREADWDTDSYNFSSIGN